MHRPTQYNRFTFFCGAACLALIYRVHFHSRVLSLHDPLWAPTRHPTTTCVHWPMPFTEELCWQLVSPCRRAHMKQQPELKPERAEAMVYDPDAQTGLYCPAWHQSLLAPLPCPAQLSLAQPSLSQNGGLRPPARKHAYKSPVCIAPEGGSVPTPRSSRERALRDDRLSWGYGSLSVTTGVCVGMCCTTSMYFNYVPYHCSGVYAQASMTMFNEIF